MLYFDNEDISYEDWTLLFERTLAKAGIPGNSLLREDTILCSACGSLQTRLGVHANEAWSGRCLKHWDSISYWRI